MIQLGDLVKWETKSWVLRTRYANPGLVLECMRTDLSGNHEAWRVLWADGTVTSEHVGYLKKIQGIMVKS